MTSDDPVSVYLREIATVTPVTDEEAHRLTSLRPLSESTKQRLAEGYLGGVVAIASGFRGLRQTYIGPDSNVRLLRAVERFAESGQTHFSHYVCVEQQIRRFIAGT